MKFTTNLTRYNCFIERNEIVHFSGRGGSGDLFGARARICSIWRRMEGEGGSTYNLEG